MKKRGIIALVASVLITAIPLPVSTVLTDPMAGMTILIAYFFLIMPLFFLFLGGYLGKYWKKLWWIPLVAAGLFSLLGKVGFETWQFIFYVPGYLILGYGAMLVWIFLNRRSDIPNQRDIMDLQDL